MSETGLNVATLQLQGRDTQVQALVDALGLAVRNRWTEGERSRRGGVHARSGCTAVVADAENPVALTDQIHALLSTCDRLGYDFAALDVQAELSVAMTIGNSGQYVAAIEWSASDLALLGKLNIALVITAYPTSDDVAAEEDPLQDFWR